MFAHLKKIFNEITNNNPVLAATKPVRTYSLRDKWWLANVTAGNNKPIQLDTFYNDGRGYIQGFGSLNEGAAVLLPMRSGNQDLFRVQDSASYSDFGSVCYSARTEYMGLYWGQPPQAPQ